MSLFGNDGDDIMRISNANTIKNTVHGGKGDDIIGEVEFNDTKSEFGFHK